MTVELPMNWRALAGFVALALVAGGLAGTRANRGAPPRARVAAAPFAAASLARTPAAGPERSGAWSERFARAPKPLAESAFADAGLDGGAIHVGIHGPLEDPSIRVKLLGRPEGSFLFSQEKGWLKFEKTGWRSASGSDLPAEVLRRWPEPPRAAMRLADRRTRDGFEEPAQ